MGIGNVTTVGRRAGDAREIDHYIARARRLRRIAIRRALRAVKRALVRQLRRAQNGLAQYRERRATYRELAGMDLRELRDIGLTAADVHAIDLGAYFADSTRRARPLAVVNTVAANEAGWIERAPPGVQPATSRPGAPTEPVCA
jgi:uncharacterized protein YjiS (DUF1127 family)